VASDSRDQRIEELEAQVAEQGRRIEELESENHCLRARVCKLDALVAKLKEKTSQNSRNSSRPPSSDGPSKPVRRKKRRSGRKRGGQVGHEKHERELVPVEQVDSLTVVKPTQCVTCSVALSHFDVEPKRHQYYELPEVKPLVHEVQVHSGWCEHCQSWTQGQLPPEVPRRAFAPSVDAVVGLLMGVYRLSKRSVAAILGELFNLKMSVGAVVVMETKTAGTCKKILKIFPALWTFVRVEGVEPTNNTAERTVRHGVIYRKITYGTQSEWGSRFVERILTIHATCKQQGRSPLKFIRLACQSALMRSAPPSLIPAASDERHDSTERPVARAA
jgi:uncharacterized coiled-coil protein SlyX